MTAPDHREDNNGLVFPEADTDFLQNSTWQNFDSDAKDQSPKKPQRRVQRRNSMIETYTTDVFGTNILTEDPWADFGDGFNTDGKWRDGSCRTTGTFSDSSEDDDPFPDSDPEGEEGTMPLQDHNRIERNRSRNKASRGRQGRRGSQGSKSSEDSSKRRNRSRSKASFVAGARRGRSLSVPRSAMDINETQDRPPSSPRRSVSPRQALRLNRKFDSESPSSSKNRSRSQSRTRGSSQEEKKPRKSQTKEKSRKSQGEEKARKTDRKSKSSGKQNEEKNKGEEKSRKADRKSKSNSKQLDDRSEHKSKSTSKQLDDRSEHKSKSSSKQLDDRSEHKSKSSSKHKDEKSERKSKSPSKLREDKIDRRSKSPTRNSGKRSERKSKSPTKYAEKSSERKSKSPLKQREERRGRRSKSPTRYAEGRSERKSKSPRRGRRSKSPTRYAEERLERKSKSPSRLAEDTSQKTEIKTKSPSQKENIPVSEKKKNGQSLFAKPLPPKSYLSRGTQKRCYAGVSKEMNQRRSNIKSALANIFNDNEQEEEESNHSTMSDSGSRRRRSSSAPRRRGCRSRSRSREGKPSSADVGTKSEHSQRPRVKDRRLRRHSIIGASPSDVSDASDHSSRFESDCFSRPRSAESLLDNPRNTMPRTLRRNASIEPKKKRTYVFEV